MVDITLLGTAALAPIPGRQLTAATLACNGRVILFDCGEGTQTAARAAGVSLMKADVIALTHYHGDHIFGLPGLMQTLNRLGRTESLTIVGPEGLEAIMEPIMKLVGSICYSVDFMTLPEAGLCLGELNRAWPDRARLTAFATKHQVPSQGYCFTLERAGRFSPQRAEAMSVPREQWRLLQRGQSVKAAGVEVSPSQVLGAPRRGLKFVFSGDTMACDALVQAASGADLLICEATYGGNEQAQLAAERGHMTFAQAAETAAKAGARRLWLAHYSQMIEDPLDYLPEAAAIFDGAVCGADGMATTLKYEAEGEDE